MIVLFLQFRMECSEFEAKAQVEFDKVKENKNSFEAKLKAIQEVKNTKLKELKKIKK